MLKRSIRMMFASVLVGGSAIAAAATLRVPEEFATIQAAVHAAHAGDTVLVAPGTYFENLHISISVTLRSSGGAENTVIDGRGMNPVILARGTGGEQVTIAGFTITNGLSTLDHLTGDPGSSAGGIHVLAMTIAIQGNIIRNNLGCFGSGITASASAVTIEANQITDNLQHPTCATTGEGGGVLLTGDGRTASVMAGNVIARNRIGGYGGGIATRSMTRLSIRDNVLSGNQAPNGYGGGLALLDSGATVSGNTFVGNSALSGGGMALFPIDAADRTVVAEANLLTGNQAAGDSSAVLLLPFGQQNLRFTRNIVEGDSAVELIQCLMSGYAIASSNVLRNASGPLLGDLCAPR